MTTVTKKEHFERRLAQLEAQKEKKLKDKISRLKKLYEKTQRKIYLIMLQNLGVDCDYIPGYDDGEAPKGETF